MLHEEGAQLELLPEAGQIDDEAESHNYQNYAKGYVPAIRTKETHRMGQHEDPREQKYDKYSNEGDVHHGLGAEHCQDQIDDANTESN